MTELDAPDDPKDLWLIDVPRHRMLMQGDIIATEGGPVCVVAHACSMRRGSDLHNTQTVAPIRNHRVIIDLAELAEHSAPILAEVDLHEEWVTDLGSTAEPEFRRFLDADDRKLRNWLNEARTRPQVVQAVRREIRRRLSTG